MLPIKSTPENLSAEKPQVALEDVVANCMSLHPWEDKLILIGYSNGCIVLFDLVAKKTVSVFSKLELPNINVKVRRARERLPTKICA